MMRGKEQNAVLQRAITQDQFDHIAVVLKNIRGEVVLFQANGGIGVGVMPWHKFISKRYYKKQEMYFVFLIQSCFPETAYRKKRRVQQYRHVVRTEKLGQEI